MKKITEADLIYNGMPVPIDSIEFDSTYMTVEEIFTKIRTEFTSRLLFKYNEHEEVPKNARRKK